MREETTSDNWKEIGMKNREASMLAEGHMYC